MPLRDSWGNPFAFDTLRGKVVLVELVSMTCAACQAFSGAHHKGPFGAQQPQPGLQSIEKYLMDFAKVPMGHPGLAFVQLVVFDEWEQPPSVAQADAWARHFGFAGRPNRHVVVGPAELTKVSRALIPGFYLVDRLGTVVAFNADSHGNDLYRDLLPQLGKLVRK